MNERSNENSVKKAGKAYFHIRKLPKKTFTFLKALQNTNRHLVALQKLQSNKIWWVQGSSSLLYR